MSNTVQLSHDKKSLRVLLDTLPPSQPVTLQEAIDLARDLIDAVTQCGYDVKMVVDVPRRAPTEEQIAKAVVRVGHIRRATVQHPWNHTKTNMEIVMRVLEACP